MSLARNTNRLKLDGKRLTGEAEGSIAVAALVAICVAALILFGALSIGGEAASVEPPPVEASTS